MQVQHKALIKVLLVYRGQNGSVSVWYGLFALIYDDHAHHLIYLAASHLFPCTGQRTTHTVPYQVSSSVVQYVEICQST